MRQLNTDKELAWLLFGNETETEFRASTHILSEEIERILGKLEFKRQFDEKKSPLSLKDFIDQLIQQWTNDCEDMQDGGFNVDPLFMVKWLSLTYDEVSWEPISLLNKVNPKRLKRFIKNMNIRYIDENSNNAQMRTQVNNLMLDLMKADHESETQNNFKVFTECKKIMDSFIKLMIQSSQRDKMIKDSCSSQEESRFDTNSIKRIKFEDKDF